MDRVTFLKSITPETPQLSGPQKNHRFAESSRNGSGTYFALLIMYDIRHHLHNIDPDLVHAFTLQDGGEKAASCRGDNFSGT